MENYSNYMGGTNISLEGLKKYFPMVNIDGTRMAIDDWFKEIKVFETLIPNVSKVYIPYRNIEKHGTFVRIEWDKFELKNYLETNDENDDWWFFKPILIVEYGDLTKNEYYIYEYSFYEENFELVHVTKVEEQKIEIFTPKGRSLGFVNENEFLDIRIQIATHKLEGYYVMFNNEKLTIDKTGHLDKWSSGLFDYNMIGMSKLFRIRKLEYDKNKKE